MNQATSTNCIFPVTDFTVFKDKVLSWASQFNTFCFLDNHQFDSNYRSAECVMAAGVHRSLSAQAGSALTQLQQFLSNKNTWLFGHLGYDLKNEIEDLRTLNRDRIGFPDLFFFQPEILIRFDQRSVAVEGETEDAEKIFDEILSGELLQESHQRPGIIRSRIPRAQYVETIEQLKHHILRGDCYEINFCQEFFAENAWIDPLIVYKQLSDVSPNPFSCLYKLNDKYLLCASPERFLKKDGDKILSQPMKGTAKREQDWQIDAASKRYLAASRKDRSENIMVVDLVRNDLSKVCCEGSVKVEELCAVYSFPHVHQMISTISGRVRADMTFCEIIRSTFPMGSMTGAPKKKVMELIDQYEKTKRGIFSGAVGYITPTGDFDFNVVIRSIMYNEVSKYLSFQAGSAITFYSDAEQEWEECLLKAAAIKSVLGKP